MLHCKHRTIIFFSALLWFAMGVFLLTIGLRFLVFSLPLDSHASVLDLISQNLATRENAIVSLITIALLIGFLKGKYLLSRSALKEIQRVISLPNPAPIKNFYSKRYYILLSVMMCLGMTLKYVPISSDIRGFIDVTVGSALLTGSRTYLRHVFSSLQKHTPKPNS